MRKRKWFIPVVVVSVLLIGGITGGVVAAANNSSSNATAGNQSQASDRYQALLDRTCAIYEEKMGVAMVGSSGVSRRCCSAACRPIRDRS